MAFLTSVMTTNMREIEGMTFYTETPFHAFQVQIPRKHKDKRQLTEMRETCTFAGKRAKGYPHTFLTVMYNTCNNNVISFETTQEK